MSVVMAALAERVPDWTLQAACADMAEDFFCSISDEPAQRRAKALCSRCPVRTQCLEAGLAQDDEGRSEERWGIWGGLNGPQRGRLASRRGMRVNRRERKRMTQRDRAEADAAAALFLAEGA